MCSRLFPMAVSIVMFCFSPVLAIPGDPGDMTGQHRHLAITQAAGKLVIAGYSSEPGTVIDSGQLFVSSGGTLFAAESFPAIEITALDPEAGEFLGFNRGTGFTLASDAFASIIGEGDFYYEINIERLDLNGSLNAVAAYARVSAGVLVASSVARTDGATREDRSVHVPVVDIGGGIVQGTHAHGQRFYLDSPGTYRIILTAWDAAQDYEDSDPVYFLATIPVQQQPQPEPQANPQPQPQGSGGVPEPATALGVVMSVLMLARRQRQG